MKKIVKEQYKLKNVELYSAGDTRFLIVIVSRAYGPPSEFSLTDSMADSSKEVFIRYDN